MGTVLVTGGAGYIGAHAAKALAAAGHKPVVYDNLSRGHRYAVQWGPFEEGDINNAARLDAVFSTYKPDAIMHFAALSEVGISVREPLSFWRNNVAGSMTLVERALAHGVKRIVFSSTCSIYGEASQVPIDEATPEAPINPYAETKLVVERLLQSAAKAHGFDVVALRYFNAAGASPDGEIGENHTPETHLIPLVLMAAQDVSRTIKIFGTDYPTPDGSCVRDYVHVDDLASAHISALDRLLSGQLTGFTKLNLGTGQGLSVIQILEAARRITGSTIRAEREARRVGDPPILIADTRAAERILDWRPRHSDLESVIASAWAWTLRHERQLRSTQ